MVTFSGDLPLADRKPPLLAWRSLGVTFLPQEYLLTAWHESTITWFLCLSEWPPGLVYTMEHPLGQALAKATACWLSSPFCFLPPFTGFPKSSHNNHMHPSPSVSVSRELDLSQHFANVKPWVPLGDYCLISVWTPQTNNPQVSQSCVFGCSPHMGKILSYLHSLSFPDFPICPDFSQNTPWASHLKWKWDLPRGHCCLCGLLELRLLILLGHKSSDQHSPQLFGTQGRCPAWISL